MRRITATLEIRRRLRDTEPDRYGNPSRAFGEPERWPVFAVAPLADGDPEPAGGERDVRVRALTVLAPIDGPRPDALDRVVHADDEYEVIGPPDVWDRNPNVGRTMHRGITVHLRRSEG